MKRCYLFCLLFVAVFCFQSRVYAGSWVNDSVSIAAGTRNYKLWIPETYRGGKPLPMVMMLHGCSQNPDDFAAGTEMHLLGDQYNFFVVYPEQPSSANGTNCWNWFLPEHQTRNSGEPSILVAIVHQIQSAYNIRSNKVYVAGMSAGLEYKAGTDLISGVVAQQLGGPAPDLQGQLAFMEMGLRARRLPVIVFHGTLDLTVNNINGTQIINQWAQTNDLADDNFDNNSVDAIAEQTYAGTAPNNGLNFTRDVYSDAFGRPLLERWLVETMTHKWSGGSSAGSYTDPKGPNASFEMCRFFGLTGGKN